LDFPAFTRHRLIILKYKTKVNFRFKGFKGSYQKYILFCESVNPDSYMSNFSGSYLSEKQTVR